MMASKNLIRRSVGSILGAALLFSGAAWAQQIALTPSNSGGIYAPGDKIAWNVRVSGAGAETVKSATYTIRKGGGDALATGTLDLSTGLGRIETTQTEPLAYQADLVAQGADGKPIRAYGGAVVSPEKIAPSLPRPADFDAFWAQKLAQVDAIPTNPTLKPLPSERDGVDYSQITLDNIWGTKVRGQIARPTVGEKFPAVIILQWAGVYGLPKNFVTGRAASGWLALNISAHDLPIDETADFYTQTGATTLKNYATIGNDDREKSYMLRMISGCVHAAKYLSSRPDWNGQTLVATGTSQGGYQSIALAGLFPKITDVIVNVPAGCDMAGEVAGRLTPWPYWTKQNVTDANRAAVISTSAYFDPVNFASRIRVRVLAALGLIDNTATPTGILAMSNQLLGSKELVIMPLAEHQDKNKSQAAFYERSNAWFDALAKNQPLPIAK